YDLGHAGPFEPGLHGSIASGVAVPQQQHVRVAFGALTRNTSLVGVLTIGAPRHVTRPGGVAGGSDAPIAGGLIGDADLVLAAGRARVAVLGAQAGLVE